MDTRTLLLTIANVLVAAFVRALHDGLPGFLTLKPKWRAVIAAGLGIVGGIVDAVTNGSNFAHAAQAAITVSGTSFALLIVEALFGGSDGDNEAIPLAVLKSKTPSTPPAAPYSTKLVAYPLLVVAAFAVTLGMILCGCAASLENAHARGARARAVVEKAGLGVILLQAEECAVLDQEHRTWGAVAEIAGVLAGAGGISAIPIPEEQKGTRIAVATSAIVLGGVVATAVWISQDAAASWARDCASGGVRP